MSPERYCWEGGPRDERDVGSTCLLPAGHDGPHEWTPDDDVWVRINPRHPDEVEP